MGNSIRNNEFKPVTVYNPIPPSPVTGQITGTIAGTPQAGPDIEWENGFFLIGHPDNTDVGWVFTRGLTKAVGYPISTDRVVYIPAYNLDDLSFDVDVNGEIVCWLKA